MISFEIQDMTCGHCREAVTRAVLGVDRAARVEVDLSRRLVRIDSAAAESARFSQALEAAGYTPRRVEAQRGARTRPGAGGCSCASEDGGSCGMRLGTLLDAPVQAGRPLPRQGACCSTSGTGCGR